MNGKLNIFQRTMLIWNGIHPYNAVHVARVPYLLDMERLVNIIKRYLEMNSLTGLVIDRKRNRFQYNGGPADIEINVIDSQNNPITLLSEEIEEQLNRPFPDRLGMTPFRFFIIRGDGHFYLGLVYFHVISDANSIIELLKNMVNAYINKSSAFTSLRLNLYPHGYGYLITRNLKHCLRWMASLPKYITYLRSSFRPEYVDINNHTIGFSCFCIDANRFRLLLRVAKKWNVTVNDIFLALLMKSVSPFASERLAAPRRKKLSLVSIANVRENISGKSPMAFGLLLGSFSVTHSVPDGITVEQLVQDIHRQTEKIKKDKLYLYTIIEMGLALLPLSFLSPLRKSKFYPKSYPMWGGITNINLNSLWEQRDVESPIDYLRAVSTGPVAPIIFSFTSVRDVLNVGVSFRTAAFSKKDVEKIITDFSTYVAGIGD